MSARETIEMARETLDAVLHCREMPNQVIESRDALQALLDGGLDKDRQDAIAEAMIRTLPLSLQGEGEPEV